MSADANLQDCHRALIEAARERGIAVPSLITLRRHARAGALDECVSRAALSSGRTLYKRDLVLAHYLHAPGMHATPDLAPKEFSLVSAYKQSDVASLPAAGFDELIAHMTRLESKLDQVNARVEKMEHQVAQIHGAMTDLSWARKNLMSKYDAAYAAAVERANRLEQAGHHSTRSEAPGGMAAMDAARMQNDLKIIRNTLNDLVSRLP